MNRTITATLESKVSEKTGKPYKVLVIKLTPTYDKLVFLERAELELLNLQK